jgi:hypothetical protein
MSVEEEAPPTGEPHVIINVTHIDQVYVIQEALSPSRSKAARDVVSLIDANSDRWPGTGRNQRRVAFSIQVSDRNAKTIERMLRRFAESCDEKLHWRSVEVAEQLASELLDRNGCAAC